MPKPRETRIAKLSGGLSDITLVKDVLKAFFNHDLEEIKRLMYFISNRNYEYSLHREKPRGQGDNEDGLWDLSFAFKELGEGVTFDTPL